MKYPVVLLLIIFMTFVKSDLKAQDPTFSQWENIPIYFNPALTGDFEGTLRFRLKYRDQWRSFLNEDAYSTGIGSVEYKFAKGENRKVSLGFYALRDQAGDSEFTTNSYHLSTSVSQNLGNVEQSYHAISVGINIGAANRKVDFIIFPPDPFMPGPFETTTLKTEYFDLSAGLNWKYHTKTHFTAEIGTALNHVNRPDDSFSGNSNQRLPMRFSFHGNIELPLAKKISALPSFLYLKQGPAEQLLFGLSGKFYFKEDFHNFLQFGFFAKTTKNFNGTNIGVYVGSATIEINSILIGFSFDRFTNLPLDGNAYEFSLGYIIGKKIKTPTIEKI